MRSHNTEMLTRFVFDNVPSAYQRKLRDGFYPLRNLITKKRKKGRKEGREKKRKKERNGASARKTIHPQHTLDFVINSVIQCVFVAAKTAGRSG
jgi:hypothetical protein